jgi:hypothetical protein
VKGAETVFFRKEVGNDIPLNQKNKEKKDSKTGT